MSRANAVYLCGGATHRLADRDRCPDALHNWPLPAGYVDASMMADSRLAHGWSNTRCRKCGLYGWRPGQFRGLAAESTEVVPRVLDAGEG